MTITVSTADPRSLKALALLAGADRWQKGHTRDGRSFYAVPSQSGDVLHMADTRACTCRDYERRQDACKHVLAVRLHVARLQARQPRRRAARQHTPAEIVEASRHYEALMADHFGGEG